MAHATAMPYVTPADDAPACRSVAGVPVQVAADDPALGARVEPWLARALAPGDGPTTGEPIRLQVLSDQPPDPPAGARTLAATPRCRVVRMADRVFLRFPQARCDLDLAMGRARLWLAEAWWGEPLKIQQDPWLLALAWLLRERGVFALHASCVARNGRGLLIAGDSGSGKSTTALSLIQQGWDWLADDIVLFEPIPTARLRALARGFAFHAALAERLSGLTGTAVADKHFADIEGLFTGRQLDQCRPVALLFPRVAGGATSRLVSLSPVEALAALLPASGGIFAGGAVAQSERQLRALGTLVSTVPAYRLLAGQDIFGNGTALQALLTAQGMVLGGARPAAAERASSGA
jgi:hypothetical protein